MFNNSINFVDDVVWILNWSFGFDSSYECHKMRISITTIDAKVPVTLCQCNCSGLSTSYTHFIYILIIKTSLNAIYVLFFIY